jgi:branched-subunit amino acid aminotransferase/4-amino-4-deoxychorismate lyase
VFVLSPGGVLCTPPDDGRILPGVARARVLAYADEIGLQLSTEPLPLERLKVADAVVLTSALRHTPAVALDGVQLPQQPELRALLQAALAGGA